MNIDQCNNIFQMVQKLCRFPHQVSIDDEVLLEVNNNLTPAKIENISSIRMQGILLG